MGRLGLAIMLAVSIALSVVACDYVSSVNNEANRNYHDSRWQVTVEACATGKAFYAPTEPPVPRVCRTGVDPAFGLVVSKYNTIARAWMELVQQAEDNLAFSSEMLGVLESRNTVSIELLVPQIADYAKQTSRSEVKWRESLTLSESANANLKAAWNEAWQDNDLQFDLAKQISDYQKLSTPEVSGVRQEAMEHYYHNEFSRLSAKYLEYESPDFEDMPQSCVPQGCDSLAQAHLTLEAALHVRYGLDMAIEQDIELISRLAKVDFSSQSWDDINVPKGRYGEKQVSAAIARLKLLKYLDTLVTDSLGIIIREVSLEWKAVWPGHMFETNILEFAGVSKVH